MLSLVLVCLSACLLVCLSAYLSLPHRGAPHEDVRATVWCEVFDGRHLTISLKSHRAELIEVGERKMRDFAVENNVLVWGSRCPVDFWKRLLQVLANPFARRAGGRSQDAELRLLASLLRGQVGSGLLERLGQLVLDLLVFTLLGKIHLGDAHLADSLFQEPLDFTLHGRFHIAHEVDCRQANMAQALELQMDQLLNSTGQVPHFLGRYALQRLLNRLLERPAPRGINVAANSTVVYCSRILVGVFEASPQLSQAR